MSPDGFAAFMDVPPVRLHLSLKWWSWPGRRRLGRLVAKQSGNVVVLSAPEPFSAWRDVSGFSCGKLTPDHWLKMRALANQQKGFTAVPVVHEAGRVAGYYGLAPIAMAPAAMPRSIRTDQPPDPVPCLLPGQLATDARRAGAGDRDRFGQARARTLR